MFACHASAAIGARLAAAPIRSFRLVTPVRRIASVAPSRATTNLLRASSVAALTRSHASADRGASAGLPSAWRPAAVPLRAFAADTKTDPAGAPSQQETPRPKKKKGAGRRVAEALLATLLGLTAYELYQIRNEETYSWQLLMWKTLPLRFMSHVWGTIHRIDLPVFLRRPLYMAWTRAFDCQLHEIADGGESTLDSFPNLNAFFIRRIDLAKYRPLSPEEMVSPVDGRVNVFGEVTPEGRVEQIKGMEYDVADLLGFRVPELKKDSRLYYYVLYLAPGDYHRMHSPSDCVIAERRHFPGALYPVLPSIAAYIPSLFVRNERLVLNGAWRHGFFAMVPVGAYNVGSMKLTFDEGLDTNLREHTFVQYRPNLDDGLKSKPFYKNYRVFDNKQELRDAQREFVQTDRANEVQKSRVGFAGVGPSASNEVGQQHARADKDGVHLRKGEEFSRFELGSTIVVFFEMDKGQTFNWNIEQNQKVKLGQRLGVILPPTKGK